MMLILLKTNGCIFFSKNRCWLKYFFFFIFQTFLNKISKIRIYTVGNNENPNLNP